MVTFRDIEQAYRVVKPVVHKTPLLSSQTFDAHCGNEVILKAENLQRVGAFKIRGAYNKISTLSPEERSQGVVAHSSGNHAQGVALAAKLLGVKAAIVMPGDFAASRVQFGDDDRLTADAKYFLYHRARFVCVAKGVEGGHNTIGTICKRQAVCFGVTDFQLVV